jgi:chromatin remodeling complex protein RSC6
MTPSPELAEIIGKGEVARSDAVKKLWDYIKKNDRQNPENKREIIADEKLKPLFHGKDKVTMFEMNSHLAKHLK